MERCEIFVCYFMWSTFKMIFLWIFVLVAQGQSDNTTLNQFSEVGLEIRANHTDNSTHDNLDHFKLEDIDSRRHKGKDVWVWDLYCHLQSVTGNCKDSLNRFYYDAQLDTCAVFNYTGCGGNQNNFETAIDCERRCKGANFMGVNEHTLPTVCYLQPDSGLCLAFITNYYYDVDDRACKQFTYGGCGGNLNRFETKRECEEHCSLQKQTPSNKTYF